MAELRGGDIAASSSGASATARGRRASAPASPLAAFIVEQMRLSALSRETLAERLGISSSTLSRLLSGKTRWTRIAPLTLADALGLGDVDRARLLDVCAKAAPRTPLPRASRPTPATAAAPAPRRPRGRPARAATGPVGKLLEPLMAERGTTRAALAHALGVEESTVTRLMNGTHASSHAISAHRVSDAMGLHGIARREFLQRALALGAFALVSGQQAPSVLRYHAFDLEQFDGDIQAIRRILDEGRVSLALQRAQALYDTSLAAAFPRTHKQMATRRIEAALLLGQAQEAALAWGSERIVKTAQTYNHIDNHILSLFTPREFAHYYARLYERRAPHYREMEDFDESIRQFTLAIEVFMRYVDDIELLALLYRNRAHVWAQQGREREWRNDMNSAARVASRATGVARAQLEGLIIYGEAEGYKRLAGAAPSDDVARQRMYARKAIASFQAARELTKDEPESHHLLLAVSLAQAYLWLDADESARQAQSNHQWALTIFPSLARKCELTIAQAHVARARK